MNSQPLPINEFESRLVASAVSGLELAKIQGVADVSGVDALLAAMDARRPRIYGKLLMNQHPEIAERIIYLSQFVESGGVPAETVDPKE